MSVPFGVEKLTTFETTNGYFNPLFSFLFEREFLHINATKTAIKTNAVC